ncbi:GNAT family N-acetyltransferase [Pseudooceanicola nanhaiensis]|uniref:GNAT family N-acetyltransferase n=1 Tax=Pseudooceanicola nanhaiensis TaxID=375761 RepID=UPI001CD75FA1|nr:GNAT family N-acetyltransferase [Pseudooceanicola nanhaiensis]MCA0922264.1 GNAT family N-acetyltransferase [Pseudooceanicola nanhaiensis]
MSVTLRELAPGDMGWVIDRQSAIYAAEYGWNGEYEALVLRILADFAETLDPARERGWIAEVEGQRAGAVFCMAGAEGVAKLRLLHVESFARGKGVGSALVEACIAFAKAAGYREMELWTQDCLTGARRIYGARGFELQEVAPHHSFGVDLIGEMWRRPL